MYNKERKLQFIEEKTAGSSITVSSLTTAFKSSAPFEESLEKDLCNFVASEIENMFRTLNFTSLGRAMVVKSYYTGYTDWCLQQGYVIDFQNHFLEIRKSDLENMVNFAVIDKREIHREDVMEWCGQLDNPSDKAILLALYEGIKGEGYREIYEMKGGDVDYENKTIFIPSRGKCVPASKELLAFIRSAVEETEYISMSGNRGVVHLRPSDLVVKDAVNSFGDQERQRVNAARKVHNRVKRCFNALGISKWMSVNAIWIAGLCDYINYAAKESGQDTRTYLNNNVDKIKERFNYNIDPYSFYKQYESYLKG
jgi:hypothetical protein